MHESITVAHDVPSFIVDLQIYVTYIRLRTQNLYNCKEVCNRKGRKICLKCLLIAFKL
jgi:hypothetical protein